MAVCDSTSPKSTLTAELAHSRWEYRDGHLYLKSQPWNRKISRVGLPSGWVNSTGYRHVSADGAEFLAHRVIWLMHYGYLPEKPIDHINGIRDDNRIENLRLASHAENSQSGHILRSPNKSGYRGVHRSCCGKKWVSQIRAFGAHYHLGTFETKEEAALAYNKASKKYCGEFSYENILQSYP